jgi:hypothetical protein
VFAGGHGFISKKDAAPAIASLSRACAMTDRACRGMAVPAGVAARRATALGACFTNELNDLSAARPTSFSARRFALDLQ